MNGKIKEYKKRFEESIERIKKNIGLSDIEIKYLKSIKNKLINQVIIDDQLDEWITEERRITRHNNKLSKEQKKKILDILIDLYKKII
ncbi:MAG: hypothetical protein ACFFDF_19255 [Candidatus Odinarchaeota archaeon]